MKNNCLNTIFELAQKNTNVVFIGSDLGHGTLNRFKEELPNQFFMEGISESHIIGMAAGLALEGNIVYVNTIASFLTRRCLDQIVTNLCLENLPVRLIGNGAGLVYGPQGPTHMAIEDIGLMSSIPNMAVVSPADGEQSKQLTQQSLIYPGPIYFRLGKDNTPHLQNTETSIIGQPLLLSGNSQNAKIIIFSTGIMAKVGSQLSESLENGYGIETCNINLHTIKPLPHNEIIELTKSCNIVVTLEEHSYLNGLGSKIAQLLAEKNPKALKVFGLPDKFIDDYGRQEEILDYYRLSHKHLLEDILQFYESSI